MGPFMIQCMYVNLTQTHDRKDHTTIMKNDQTRIANELHRLYPQHMLTMTNEPPEPSVFMVYDLDELDVPALFHNREDAVKFAHEVILARTHDWPSMVYQADGFVNDPATPNFTEPMIINHSTKERYGPDEHDVSIYEVVIR